MATTLPHWLQRLGLVEAPEGTALRAAELSLRGPLPAWLALAAVITAAAGAFYLYGREDARLGVFRRSALALLRAALIGLVVLLLLRPVLLAEFEGHRPRAVVVLVDASQSMGQADRRVSQADRVRLAIARGLVAPTTAIDDRSALSGIPAGDLTDSKRVETVRAALRNPRLDLIGRLAEKGPVVSLLFDRRLHSPADPDDLAASLRADGTETALADSIAEVLARQADEPPAAIVVATDGRDNASTRALGEAARACRDRGVPLYVWGVGSTEAGLLQIREVRAPATVFVDDRPDVVDDPVEVAVRFRARGFKAGTVVLTVKLGDQSAVERFPFRAGEDQTRVVRVRPKKGKDRERPLEVSLRVESVPGVGDEARKVVQVRRGRVKVLYAEGGPRREYHFIQAALDRDRRVLARFYLAEADPRLAEAPPGRESGAMFLRRLPENFPDPDPRDPDRRPFDLLILGDVAYTTLGDKAARAVRRFVKEGGGLVVLAGPNHCPAELARSALAEALPVEFTRQEFPPEEMARLAPFRPVLTYDGEQSPVLALADSHEESLNLWKEGLWKNVPGFWWHYPVADLRPGATALLVHPEKKAGRPPGLIPMPLVASQFYGRGEVLFVGTDELWRWRDGTGDRLTARFWGQVVSRLGLPHLLGNARRTQLELARGGAVLGRPGSVRARLLDSRYEPVTQPEVRATLLRPGAPGEVVLRRVPGQPGEYRGALPNDVPGRHELRFPGGGGLEPATLSFTVELPPRHELVQAGLNEEALRAAAAVSGGKFYREENLHHLPDDVQGGEAPFVLRQEVLLWNAPALAAFVLLATAEWLLRKFWNLS
jgi:hypothetical protein